MLNEQSIHDLRKVQKMILVYKSSHIRYVLDPIHLPPDMLYVIFFGNLPFPWCYAEIGLKFSNVSSINTDRDSPPTLFFLASATE